MTTTPSVPEPITGPSAAAADAKSLTDRERYLNRELQWLQFNDRVLAQATDPTIPLLERVRFLSIFSSNLDEFFMKRVGGLKRQVASGTGVLSYDGQSPQQVLTQIRERVLPMTRRKAECFTTQIMPALQAEGIELRSYPELTPEERQRVDEWYRRDVFPILTPLAVDLGHRFPFISTLSVSLGVMLRRPGEDEELFARVKVPEVVSQWVRVGKGYKFVKLSSIIEHNLGDLFPGMIIQRVLPFRVTRNADVEGDNEDADDLLESIQAQLKERRFARVVRMQVASVSDRRMLNLLCEELDLHENDVYETTGLINFRSLDEIADLDLPQHHFSPWLPVIPPRLRDDEVDIFSVIREGDVFVHHPYESFDASVERFIEEAAADPNVLCIKQALYRTSGDSPFIPELIRAAEAGKQVAVLVEVRARFDEARNIEWARRLENAGVHVAYGVIGLKTHTKIALVVRREGGVIRSYAHIGTGNYNSRTARLYEDVGLLTCDPAITDDVIDLFNHLTGRSRQNEYNKLLVAPHSMKARFLELIQNEIDLQRSGGVGRIIVKMNQLQDREVIDRLYEASQAGVSIDLIVRGFCTLRPGVPGLSDNIRVISVIGRFLEHSRIYYFRQGKEDPLDGMYFIGSADWMYRNLHVRVEAACPIEDRTLRSRLWRILDTCLHDHRQAWDMHADGSYTLRSAEGLDPDSPAAQGTHEALIQMTLASRREASATDTP